MTVSSIRENIKKIFDHEKLGIKGFNTAVNILTSILNKKKYGLSIPWKI